MFKLSNKQPEPAKRIRLVAVFFLIIASLIIARLFILQVVDYDYYALFASNAHEIYEKLYPSRGQIWFKDTRTGKEYPAAINREYNQVYAVPREIPPAAVASTTERLALILGLDQTGKEALFKKLSNAKSAYGPIAKKIDDAVSAELAAARLPGVYQTASEWRYYPEEALGGNSLGFVGWDDKSGQVGRYGIEGYWEKKLAGRGGFSEGEQSALGSWITLGRRLTVAPENGAEIVLTLDRALEYTACERLKRGLAEYEAKSASLVLLDVKTGAILALCSLPDFDPNLYSTVTDQRVFNNTAIFTPYEPGSVFKTITMAAGLDSGLITPATKYTDPCDWLINGHHIRNAERKCYGEQTMTEVLEKSINTGVVWVEEKLGNERFNEYVKRFGFGVRTGVALHSEVAGDISSLSKSGQIFGANGSFGQGLTVTPLQLAAAYGSVANRGQLLKPFIVSEVRYPDGRRDQTKPVATEQVISTRASELLTGMLVSVVENHYRLAKIKGYYVAGKTGTAQIAEKGAYSEHGTNHTFAGFAPAGDSRFALVVKYEEPARRWAEETALPVFKDVMQFALQYASVPTER